MPVVVLVQLSKSPVSLCPVLTLGHSKHWSQLLDAKDGFDVQLTGVDSPREMLDAVLADEAAFIWTVVPVEAADMPIAKIDELRSTLTTSEDRTFCICENWVKIRM